MHAIGRHFSWTTVLSGSLQRSMLESLLFNVHPNWVNQVDLYKDQCLSHCCSMFILIGSIKWISTKINAWVTVVQCSSLLGLSIPKRWHLIANFKVCR